MNHYCTYFDRGFLAQGLALWRSLSVHDPDAILWVLALDDFTATVLREIGGTGMRTVTLAEIEANDPELVVAKANRSQIEYYFTLSPCWPSWLLLAHPEIERMTYVDADMFFFANPAPVFELMDKGPASVLVTAHRFAPWQRAHYERHGIYNVGILSFRNDVAGRGCLEDWRARCLDWCHDRLENGKYADQKYLDDWPARLGSALIVLDHPGVNLAPWNWVNHRYAFCAAGVCVDGQKLLLFHFARFRTIWGNWWWQSGQLDYGVMPWCLRNALYAPYWRALVAVRCELAARYPGIVSPKRTVRLDRAFWRTLPLRLLFGSDWLLLGNRFISGRLGLGRYSGCLLSWLRRVFSKDTGASS